MTPAVKLIFVGILTVWLFFLPREVLAAFNIDSISPTTITSIGQEMILFVSATNLDNKTQFFQTAITKEGKTNYFGFTNNNAGEWKKYESTPSDYTSFFAFTPVSAKWSGQIKSKIDPSDSGFSGNGTYTVKLLKYISSSQGSSSNNTVSINVDIPSENALSENAASPSPSPTSPSDSEKPKPTLIFSLPNSADAGQPVSLHVKLNNFPAVPFFIKVRIGPNESRLTHGQTQSGSVWWGDNDSWTNFPQISGPNWQGEILTRISQDQKEGIYKIVVRLKKVETNSIWDSESKDIFFQSAPSQSQASNKTSSSAPSTVKSTASASSFSEQSGDNFHWLSQEDASVDGKILGLSSESAKSSPSSLHKKNPILIESEASRELLSLKDALISSGLFIVGFSTVWSLRRKVKKVLKNAA